MNYLYIIYVKNGRSRAVNREFTTWGNASAYAKKIPEWMHPRVVRTVSSEQARELDEMERLEHSRKDMS